MDVVLMSATCTGLAAWAAVRWAMSAGPRPELPDEERRRARLRAASGLVQHAECFVLTLAAGFRAAAASTAARVRPALLALGEEFWRGEEYLAARSLIYWLLAPGVAALVGWRCGWLVGTAVLLLVVLAVPLFVAWRVRKRAEAHVRVIRSLLPAALDLMTLVLEAGGETLVKCLQIAAEENAGNPLGAELGRVVQDVAAGAAPRVALAEMSRRLADDDITDVNLTIAASQSYGPPLKDTLRQVATRIRTRQVQWQEESAAKTQVGIVGPVMVASVASMALLAAPFILGGMAVGGGLIP